MKTEVSTLEDRCTRMATKLKEETEMRLEMEEKVANYDKMFRELTSTSKEHNALKDLHEKQATALATLTVSEQSSRSAERDAVRAKELLAMDKAYLSQELRAAEARANEAAKSADTNGNKVVSLEMKVQQLSDQLLNSQLDARTGVEERITKETERLREDSKREMEALREATKEIIDRENKVLREAKDSAEAESEKVKTNNAFLQNENTRLQTEIVSLQGKNVGDLSELRAELKLKNFELTALGTTFEERMTTMRQTELELQTTKKELEAHKAAFVRLESEHDVKTSELSAQLGVASNRLKAYESLEEEIDSAVLRVAQAGSVAADGTSGGGKVVNDNIDNEDVSGLAGELAAKSFFTSLQTMPSQPERRARQAVLLAQKVLETEKQRDGARAEAAELREAYKAAKEQEKGAEEALKRSSQPTVYLVTKLRDEEAAHALTQAKVKSTNTQLRKKEAQLGALNKDYTDVKERLTLILHQRADIDKIRDVLESLTAARDGDEASMGDDIDEDDDGGSGAPGAAVDGPSETVVNTSAFGSGSPRGSPRGLTVDVSAPPAPASAGNSPRAKPSPAAAAGAAAGAGAVGKMTTSPSVSPSNNKGNGRWHKRETL